jgi:predicted enzyme related to lactoylglutathione lyase
MSRLCHVIAFTKNFEAMREFYSERVGLRVRQQEPRWVAFETGGACLGLLDMPDERKQGIVLRFETGDLEAERRAIAARGVRTGDPISFSGGRLIDVWDPEDNLIQFLEPPRALPVGSGPAIQRVILNVGDFGRAVSFYRGSMGFPVVGETAHWVEFDTGGTRLAVHHRPGGADHPRHAEQPITLVFGTDDLTAWCEAMRGRGLRFVTAPVMEEFGVYAEAVDPDGRIVVFYEPPLPESLEEELAEAYEDDGAPQRSAMRKPVKKGSATVSMMALKPAYKKSKVAPRRRRPSATTTSVVSVRGAGPDHSRLRPKRTADEKKARTKPGIGRLKKAEIRTIASQRTAVARTSKSRPVKRASANSSRRRGNGRGKSR